MLGKIFGPDRDDVTGDGRRLHKEELIDLYSTPAIITYLLTYLLTP